jgi:hypothetical protein
MPQILLATDRHPTGRAVALSRRLPHDDVVALLQVSDEVIGHELRHDIVAVSEPAATIMLECKAQRETKLIGIGRGQFGSVIGHAGRLDQPCEQVKNIREVSCLTATRSAILTTCQIVRFQPSRPSYVEFSASPPTDPTQRTSSLRRSA